MTSEKKQILNIIHEACRIHNIELYDVEFKGKILVVYIEKSGQGIELKDCEKMTETIKFLFLSKGISDRDLEVSSPGLNRKLKTYQHFKSAQGKLIKLQTDSNFSAPEELKTKGLLKGILQHCKESHLILKTGSKSWTIPIQSVKKAQVVFET